MTAKIRTKLVDAYLVLREIRYSDDISDEEFNIVNDASSKILSAITSEEWTEINKRVDAIIETKEAYRNLIKLGAI